MKELIDRNELIKLFEKYGAEDDAIALIKTVPVVLTIDEKWLFDYIDALPKDSPSCIALVNMYVAWRKEQESRTNG